MEISIEQRCPFWRGVLKETVICGAIGHFRVPLSLSFKASLSARLLYKIRRLGLSG